MIRWTYFPKNKAITGIGLSVVKAFEENEKNISSEANNHLIGSGGTDSHSNSVLEKVSRQLQAIGFQVELGKKKNEKIHVPVLFGEQGKPLQSFDANPFFKPACENGWHGNPASKISKGGISFSLIWVMSP
jgi:hypothetical protein